jgi:hypothetical protein
MNGGEREIGSHHASGEPSLLHPRGYTSFGFHSPRMAGHLVTGDTDANEDKFDLPVPALMNPLWDDPVMPLVCQPTTLPLFGGSLRLGANLDESMHSRSPVVLPQLTPAMPTTSQRVMKQQEEDESTSAISAHISPVKFTLQALSQEQLDRVREQCIPLNQELDLVPWSAAMAEQSQHLVHGETLLFSMQGTSEGVTFERLHSLLLSLHADSQILSVYQVEQQKMVRHFRLAEHVGLTNRELLIENQLHENIITLLARMVAFCLQEASTKLEEDAGSEASDQAQSQYVAPEPTMDDGWLRQEHVLTSELLHAHPNRLARLATSRVAKLAENQYFDGPLQPTFHVYKGTVHPVMTPSTNTPTAEDLGTHEISTPKSQLKDCRFVDSHATQPSSPRETMSGRQTVSPPPKATPGMVYHSAQSATSRKLQLGSPSPTRHPMHTHAG